MSNPALSIPNCPNCGLPMIPDASELQPTGIAKTIFHCPACRAEAARIAKIEKPLDQPKP
jgi:hypothetical protein